MTTLGFMSWGIVVGDGGDNASRCPTNMSSSNSNIMIIAFFAFLSVGRRSRSRNETLAPAHWPLTNRDIVGDVCRVVDRVCALFYSCMKINYRLLAFMLLCVCDECHCTANVIQSEPAKRQEKWTKKRAKTKIPLTFYNLYTLAAYKNVMSFSCSLYYFTHWIPTQPTEFYDDTLARRWVQRRRADAKLSKRTRVKMERNYLNGLVALLLCTFIIIII